MSDDEGIAITFKTHPVEIRTMARAVFDEPLCALHDRVADLESRLAESHRLYQRTLHRAEQAEARLGAEVRAAKTDTFGLVVSCDNPGCCTPPLRIRVCPPEDAIPAWIRGCGWAVTETEHLCPACGGRK